jgi:hypothetical protein
MIQVYEYGHNKTIPDRRIHQQNFPSNQNDSFSKIPPSSGRRKAGYFPGSPAENMENAQAREKN